MRIQSISGKGDFNLIEEEIISTLKYKNWFSGKASANLFGRDFEIKPTNIWSSRFIIYRNKAEIGEIVFNWKGNVIITYTDSDADKQIFKMKARGAWRLRFEVFDQEDRLMLTMSSKSNWRKLSYNYKIAFTDLEKPKSIEELLVYCGYGANLYVQIIAAG